MGDPSATSIKVTVQINNKLLCVEVDIGAVVSIMSEKQFQILVCGCKVNTIEGGTQDIYRGCLLVIG